MVNCDELFKSYAMWRDGKISNETAIDIFFNALIDISDPLEDHENKIKNMARREGMIEALRWVKTKRLTFTETCALLTRLENGGDL